jgi:hypothetical protein
MCRVGSTSSIPPAGRDTLLGFFSAGFSGYNVTLYRWKRIRSVALASCFEDSPSSSCIVGQTNLLLRQSSQTHPMPESCLHGIGTSSSSSRTINEAPPPSSTLLYSVLFCVLPSATSWYLEAGAVGVSKVVRVEWDTQQKIR